MRTDETDAETTRQLIVLRGSRAETRDGARAWIARAPSLSFRWFSNEASEVDAGAIADRRAGDALGVTVAVAVVDGHGGVDPLTLGRVYGIVASGGALILRLDAPGPDGSRTTDAASRRRLCAWPYPTSAVGDRWFRRFVALAEAAARHQPTDRQPAASTNGSDVGAAAIREFPEQSRVIAALVGVLTGKTAQRAVVEAPRGRGKSAALGLAVGRALRDAGRPRRVLIASADTEAVDPMMPFLAAAADDPRLLAAVTRTTPAALARDAAVATSDERPIIVIDEAARVPLPVLKRIATQHAEATLLFATTTDGYEGTGQGFVLRFVSWLMAADTPCARLTLHAPIRWAEPDVIEPFVYDALLLDAAPADAIAFGPDPCADAAEWRVFNHDGRDALIADDALLGEVFGLLRHAHYRTTPRDLEALLDAPNMHVHVLLLAGHVAAVCLVADEGALTPELDADVFFGRTRLLAHALPDCLVAHMGLRGAGTLRFVRSVRIASHPALRRLGLASRLVEAVHAHHAPDVFGTLFGATADVVEFRRRLGYSAVRVSASRGARTGEPSVMMLRGATPRGEALVARARRRFEREWQVQKGWIFSDDGLPPDPTLLDALADGTAPWKPAFNDQELDEAIATYLLGPQTLEQSIAPLEFYISRHAKLLPSLPLESRILIEARVIDRDPWSRVAERAGMAHGGVAMRAMRRAITALRDAVNPTTPPGRFDGGDEAA